MSISMCDERRRAERQHDVVRARRLLDGARQLEPPPRHDALEQLLGAGLVERHLARRQLIEHGLPALDSDRGQAAVRERQREGQADTAEADDGDACFHAA